MLPPFQVSYMATRGALIATGLPFAPSPAVRAVEALRLPDRTIHPPLPAGAAEILKPRSAATFSMSLRCTPATITRAACPAPRLGVPRRLQRDRRAAFESDD